MLPNGEEEYILYNCASNKIMLFINDIRSIIDDNIKEPSGIKKIHPDLYDYLCENNFIVPKSYDEVEESVANRKKKMEDSSYFNLTINPTLNCNLRCWYCYETHIPGSHVAVSTMNAIKKLLKSKAESEKVKHIGLNFFGGEPLLEFKSTIMPLIEYTDEICKANDKPLHIGFTTNGVLLTPRVSDILSATGIQMRMQIPFDGDSEKHNAVKKFVNGKGTYRLIISNIKYAVKKKIHCIIRCNYSLDNVDSFHSLIDELKDFALENTNLLTFSFHQIWQTTSGKEPSLGGIIAKMEQLGLKHNYKPTIDASGSMCYADKKGAVVINCNGDVYKCTARDFIPERRDGVLNDDGTVVYNERYKDRMKSPFANPTCIKCSVFPICSTCTQKRMEHSTNKTCVVNKNETHRMDMITTRIRLLAQQAPES